MTDKELKDLVANLSVVFKESKLATDKAIKESKLETDKAIKKSRLETDKALKESKQETDKALQELKQEIDRLVKFNDKNRSSIRSLRGLGFSIGEAVEEFYYQSFKSKPTMGHIEFDRVINKFKGLSGLEFDIVLVNDIYLGVIEVKHKMRPNDIKNFLKKIPEFKKDYLGKYEKKYKLVAGLASYVYSENSDQLAQKNGLFLFSRYGQKLRVLNDEKFQAIEF